ncbi:uncharacterized protein PHALS_08978 [Plasmopara halstedii]|uniref:Uncharacterized protein n=1 Tax=Plasmopara halstedii TaxID=4781 RepID=A0A0P1AEP4_PLAHL|nr:uncharacterized protein PHALS_08978 [Plasmopara halstedii]CEG38933.1 hypothetical protein PHALS_08978 [Plasmopara halstedii]|eukprot:XP_024575302.1 hypothetical protein PHALS_08978 [Plasmopara halstedii]
MSEMFTRIPVAGERKIHTLSPSCLLPEPYKISRELELVMCGTDPLNPSNEVSDNVSVSLAVARRDQL